MAEDLRRAMADKDFRENAPLDAARENQAHLEARIRDIETTLKHAVTVGSTTRRPDATAGVGSRIVLRNLKFRAEVRYMLVSPSEVNPAEGKISIVMGKCTHRWIVETPAGEFSQGQCRICGEERRFRNSGGLYEHTANHDWRAKRQQQKGE